MRDWLSLKYTSFESTLISKYHNNVKIVVEDSTITLTKMHFY